MPKGVYERKPKDETQQIDEPKSEAKPDMFPVKLLKNYRPIGQFEIVGFHRPEKLQKNSDGKTIVIEESAFIEGEMAPPPFAGVGFDTKIWAETVVKLPIDEARRLVGKNIAERADAIPG